MPKTVEIKDFARRVERLCDFLISKKTAESGRDGSDDLRALENLKEDAADIQFDKVDIVSDAIHGLDVYMNGPDIPVKES